MTLSPISSSMSSAPSGASAPDMWPSRRVMCRPRSMMAADRQEAPAGEAVHVFVHQTGKAGELAQQDCHRMAGVVARRTVVWNLRAVLAGRSAPASHPARSGRGYCLRNRQALSRLRIRLSGTASPVSMSSCGEIVRDVGQQRHGSDRRLRQSGHARRAGCAMRLRPARCSGRARRGCRRRGSAGCRACCG
jgi:hypothetical protein